MKKERTQFNYVDKLVRVLLIILGAMGIMGTLISCALNLSLMWPALITSTLVAVFEVVTRRNRKVRVGSSIALILVFAAVVIINRENVYEGVCHITNRVLETLSGPYNLGLPRIVTAEFTGDVESSTRLVIILLTILVTLFVTGVAMGLSGFVAGIATTVPLLILFISCGVIPNVNVILICILWTYGMMAKRKGKKTSIQIAITLAVGLLAMFVSQAVVDKDNYLRPQFIENGSDFLRSDLNIDMGNTMTGQTGMSNGLLGKYDKLQYSGEEKMTVVVPSIGKTQYFPMSYSGRYKPFINSWTMKAYVNSQKTIVELVKIYEKNNLIRNYIDGGTGKFDELVRTYNVSIKSKLAQRYDMDYDTVDIDSSLYKTFENVFENYAVITNNDTKSSFSIFYRTTSVAQKSLKADYTSIDEASKSVIKEIMGDQSVDTIDEKIAYIEKVKDFLSDNYRYTLSPGRVPEGKDFLEYFLNDSRRGYCTYFATAATLMFQAAGIPARYVEGYVVDDGDLRRYGEKQGDNYSYTVTDKEAHAWVEVYFEGIGMVPVEVTPATLSRADTGSVQIAGQVEPQEAQEYIRDAEIETQTDPDNSNEAVGQNIDSNGNPQENESETVEKFSLPAWSANVLIGLLMVVIIVVAVIRMRKFLFNKRIKMRDDGDVLSLYAILERRLRLMGYAKPDDCQYEDYGKYLSANVGELENYDMEMIMNVILECRFGNAKDIPEEKIKKAAEQLFAILQAFHFRLNRVHVRRVQ